ncbi:protein amalgam-like [Microplitis mediator]|uniref:protein amalgam-like n=1 Tax=Microplitis mediator TaxID=375433 RepID=UPI0025569454|nr:protein amalgam-like [Microplitis mediator]
MHGQGMRDIRREAGLPPVNKTLNAAVLLRRSFCVLVLGLIGQAIGYGSPKTHPYQETFTSGPAFVRPVGNQTAAIGREAVFSCYVRNIGKYKVGWLRASDQTVLSLNTRIVTHNNRIAVSYEAGGCAGTSNGISMGSGSTGSIASGNSGSVPVIAAAVAVPVHGVIGSNQVIDEGVNCTWRLHIRHLKKADEGCYMCQINTSPMISELGCLSILVPPDIVYGDETSKDLSVSEGENVTLNCQATGTPKPRVSWRREDGQHILIRNSTSFSSSYSGKSYNFQKVEIYNESKLHFYRVDRQQMGVYMCIATNDVPPTVSKRVALEVNFAPTVQVRSQLLGAPLGTRVQLDCSIEAHPNTINFWERNRTEMLVDGPKYEIHEERSGYQVVIALVIKKFTEQDVGTYVCIASNILGKAEGTSRLYKINLTDDVSIIGGLAEAARGSRSSSNTRPSSLFFISLGAISLFSHGLCSLR